MEELTIIRCHDVLADCSFSIDHYHYEGEEIDEKQLSKIIIHALLLDINETEEGLLLN